MLAIVASWTAGEFFLRRFDRGFIEAFVSLGLFLDRDGRRLAAPAAPQARPG